MTCRIWPKTESSGLFNFFFYLSYMKNWKMLHATVIKYCKYSGMYLHKNYKITAPVTGRELKLVFTFQSIKRLKLYLKYDSVYIACNNNHAVCARLDEKCILMVIVMHLYIMYRVHRRPVVDRCTIHQTQARHSHVHHR